MITLKRDTKAKEGDEEWTISITDKKIKIMIELDKKYYDYFEPKANNENKATKTIFSEAVSNAVNSIKRSACSAQRYKIYPAE